MDTKNMTLEDLYQRTDNNILSEVQFKRIMNDYKMPINMVREARKIIEVVDLTKTGELDIKDFEEALS